LRAQTCHQDSSAGIQGIQGMGGIHAEETPGAASWPKPTDSYRWGLAAGAPPAEPQRGVGKRTAPLPLASGEARIASTIGRGGGHHFRSAVGIAVAATPREADKR